MTIATTLLFWVLGVAHAQQTRRISLAGEYRTFTPDADSA